MSKATHWAASLELVHKGKYANEIEMKAAAHLRALDASHRQLLEALEACLAKGSRWHTCDPIVTNARAAIATAKELQ